MRQVGPVNKISGNSLHCEVCTYGWAVMLGFSRKLPPIRHCHLSVAGMQAF